ncbi:hypothetical protein F8388_007294 [Cannabis sativa]|uniref:PHD-type domain-containing protein n=1 Tax=Cannabis sativa TaxID=3483 RepID=A0A7J6FHH5_CANSA|nr:hypothetical protein F8388_007294 [Cannabis sativa]
MKDCLRSGKRYAKTESGKDSLNRAVVESIGHEENHVSSESGDEKVKNSIFCGPELERESLVNEGLEESGGLGVNEVLEESAGLGVNEVLEESAGLGVNEVLEESAGLCGDEGSFVKVDEVADNGRKRKRVDGAAFIDSDGVGAEKKKVKVKAEQLSNEVPVVRRVLRSSSVLAGEGDKVKVSEDIFDLKTKEGDKSEKKLAEQNKVNRDQLDGGLDKISGHKRKRPPLENDSSELKKLESDGSELKKVESVASELTKVACDASELKKVESDACELKKVESGACELKKVERRGRPRKVENEVHGQLALGSGLKKKVESDASELKKVESDASELRKVVSDASELKKVEGDACELKKVESDACELKKVERRGRPRKVENEVHGQLASGSGLKKKVESDAGKLKKVERRGRPRKVENEVHGQLASGSGLKKKVESDVGKLKKVERRGRPRKVKNEVLGQLASGSELKKVESDATELMKVDSDATELKKVEGDATELKVERRGRPRKVENEVHGQLALGSGLKKKVESGASELKKVERRGRPRKVENEVHVQLASGSGLKKKLRDKRRRPLKMRETRGRPRKVQEGPGVSKLKLRRPSKTRERNKSLKRNLGRLHNVENQENNKLISDGQLKKLRHTCGMPLKGDVDMKEREIDVDDIGQPVHSVLQPNEQDNVNPNLPACLLCQETEQNGNELNVDILSSPNKNKIVVDSMIKEAEATTRKRSKAVHEQSLEYAKRSVVKGKTKKKDGEEEPPRSVVKQSVREKIIELLLSAGWTIQRRPRASKDYLDAVYVSPDGKTHWSVTLAYKRLRKHYENGDGEDEVYKAGFKFIPIPDEEFGMLKRVAINKRGENKLKRKAGKESGKTERTRKLVAKLQRGRSRKKSLHCNRENSAGTQHKRIPILVRGHKQKKTQNGKQRTLLVRSSLEDADSDSDGYILYSGSRTVLAWMIDMGTVSLNGKVHCLNRRKTHVLLEGQITRNGILCDCCRKTLTISEFESHAGSNLCEPYNNIFLESGPSLLECLLDSWNKQLQSECKGFLDVDVNGEDPNDDTCGICGDGGDLICCDGCPSTFHQSCLDIQNFPSGDWHCVYCSCKFCGMAGGREFQENDDDDLGASEFFTCHLCEEKFHHSCSRESDAGYNFSSASPFCGSKCQQLFEKLKTLIGVKHKMEEGFSWTLVRRSSVGSSTSVCDRFQECNEAQKIECNGKIAVALSIMDECFLPMVDNRSGINLIHNIVYNFGSNFNRLNYSGFLTVILERGDEIVCVASVRIHGTELAEMPFIGTRYMYRRQGMCRRLLCAIESVLCSLNVEKLVLPAISQLTETWTSVFGFRPLEISHKKKMKNMNLLVFPGVQMLQKPLLNIDNAEKSSIIAEGPRSSEPGHHTKEEVLCKTDETGIKGCVSNISSEANPGVNINETASVSGLQRLDVCLNNTENKCLIKLSVAHDNMEGKIISFEDSHGLPEQTKETSDCQKDFCGPETSVLDQKVKELGRQFSQWNISGEKIESSVLLCTEVDATKTGGSSLCASRDDTECVHCEAKVEDHTVANNLDSYDKVSTHCSAGISASELDEKIVLSELEVSVENGCHDSDSRTGVKISSDDIDSCHHPEEKILKCHVNDCAAAQQTSVTVDDKHMTSNACSVSQNTNKVSADAVHPILSQEAQDDIKDRIPLPVDSNCDPSCAASVDSNCKSNEVISSSLGVVVDGLRH